MFHYPERFLKLFLQIVAISLLVLSSPEVAVAKCTITLVLSLSIDVINDQPLTTVQIEGQNVRLVADTSSFFSTLTRATATRLNLPLRHPLEGVSFGENYGGINALLTTTHTMSISGHLLPATDFIVGGDGSLTGDHIGILGENFLTVRDTEFDLADGIIRTFDSEGCAAQNMAYWASPSTVFDKIETFPSDFGQVQRIIGTVFLNGRPVRALFDTGTTASILRGSLAIKIGAIGSADHPQDTTVPLKKFQIGSEVISNTKVRVGDLVFDDVA